MSIPEKLYIPTVTLNFNNIMSSESVSPASFYEKRGFGYKRFKKEPNNLENRIVLYDKYPVFDVRDQDLENYPLAIEIDTKSLDEGVVQEQNGSFFADETIYLNPFTTKIYFRNEQEKTSTLSKAEPSIETKMVALYKNCFKFKPKNIDCFELNIIAIEDSKIDNSKFISKDRKINKLKGLLYAYLLAANKSVSTEVASKKQLSKTFLNFFSALVRTPDAELKEKQIKFIELEVSNFLEKEIDKANNKTIKTATNKLPVLEEYKVSQTPNQKGFLTKLFNECLKDEYDCNMFIQSRYKFAKSCEKVFEEEYKEEYKKEWDGSSSQKYIKALLENLSEYKAFNIEYTDNLTLKSFAAFCKKGNSDIDNLENYLISIGIGDFRTAFSLWGIIFGFANIPKTLTNDLFLSGDSSYISEVYKYIYKQVHGVELEGELIEKKQKEDITIPPENIPVNKSAPKDISDGSDIISRLSSCKLRSEQLENIQEKYKQNNFVINKTFFELIHKINGIGPKTLEKIKKALGYKPTINEVKKDNSFFGETLLDVGSQFYKDTNILVNLVEFLPTDANIKKQFKADLEWFQGNHNEFYNDKKNGPQKGFYFDKPKDNVATIERFKKYLENKANSDKNWLRNIYSQIDIMIIINKLKLLYLQSK